MGRGFRRLSVSHKHSYEIHTSGHSWAFPRPVWQKGVFPLIQRGRVDTYYVFGRVPCIGNSRLRWRKRSTRGCTGRLASAACQFIEDLVRPHVVDTALDAGYQAMAADMERETEAQEWCNALAGDVADETR